MKNSRKLFIVALFGFAGSAFAQIDPQRDFVVAGKNAYLILPQQFVCGPTVKEVSWSQDGARLAILREYTDIEPSAMSDLIMGNEVDRSQMEPEIQVVVWSAVSRKASTVLRLKKSQGQISFAGWIAGSSSMLVEGNFADQRDGKGNSTSLTIISNTGQLIPVAQFEDVTRFEALPSPVQPVVALFEHPIDVRATPGNPPPPRQPASLRFFGIDGGLSAALTMPGPTCIPIWSNNGSLYVISFERQPNQARGKKVWYFVNRTKNLIEPVDAPADLEAKLKSGDPEELKIQNLSPKLAGIKVGVNAPTVVISAPEAKDDELSILTTDGKDGILSPKLNAVSYAAQGSLMVREMVKVPLEAYHRAKLAAIKTRIISQAKQVALAMIMYSSDYDDNYVSNNGNWQSAVQPYLKDMNLMDGFVLTFAGGPAANISDPANTQLGYIEGPGGRAVAYSDGHVRWIPNP